MLGTAAKCLCVTDMNGFSARTQRRIFRRRLDPCGGTFLDLPPGPDVTDRLDRHRRHHHRVQHQGPGVPSHWDGRPSGEQHLGLEAQDGTS